MSHSRRSGVFRELGFYFRGYKIKKQTGKHKDSGENPNTVLCGPAGICEYHRGASLTALPAMFGGARLARCSWEPFSFWRSCFDFRFPDSLKTTVK